MTVDLIERLAAEINLRDLGGMVNSEGDSILHRRLFRSGLPGKLSPELRSAIEEELGVTDVVDIRRNLETREHPVALFDRARIHQFPLLPDGVEPVVDPVDTYQSVADWYWRQITLGEDSVRQIFELLADNRHQAVLIHCHAGKDRTGSVIALVLLALGIPRESILDDYASSGTMVGDSFLAALPPKFAEADRESMRILLERVDSEYGSIDGYLKEIGVEGHTVTAIRERLLDRANRGEERW